MDGQSLRQRRARYNDEDTTPTTEHELRGWYSYAVAAEVFAVVGMNSFIPVLLEQMARERGVLRSDGVTPCVAPPSSIPASSPEQFRSLIELLARDDDGQGDIACMVDVMGVKVATSSFALYTISGAVVLQVLVLISVGAIADHGNHRKIFLLMFAWVGATACMLFIFVQPNVYLLAPFLASISICCLGNSNALLNAFLPLLVANHNGHFGRADQRWVPNASAADDVGPARSSDLSLANRMSARGIGTGYAAAVFVQLMAIGVIILMDVLGFSDSATTPMRVVLLLVGVWWAAFTFPTYLWLRSRPGPRLKSIPVTAQRWAQPFHYVRFAWRSLFITGRQACKLKQVCIFLVAWFIMSDAIATVSNVAILFARTELHMGMTAISFISITATLSGLAGAALWPWIQKRLGLETNRVIIACICLSEIIPLYGLFGFISPVLGLRQPWEIYPLAIIHGIVMGGLNTYCRSLYGMLIPPGSEAAFYALYAVTDKGSSVIGPAVIGTITDRTGSVRMGFWFLAVLVVLPIPLMWWVDAETGRRDALRIAGEEDGIPGERYESVPLSDRAHGRGSTEGDENAVSGLLENSDDEVEDLPD